MDDIAAACGGTTAGVVQNGPGGAGLIDHDKRIGDRHNEDFRGLEELKAACGIDGEPHVLGEPFDGSCKPCGSRAAAGCGGGC